MCIRILGGSRSSSPSLRCDLAEFSMESTRSRCFPLAIKPLWNWPNSNRGSPTPRKSIVFRRRCTYINTACSYQNKHMPIMHSWNYSVIKQLAIKHAIARLFYATILFLIYSQFHFCIISDASRSIIIKSYVAKSLERS